jgi:hypothetical protein
MATKIQKTDCLKHNAPRLEPPKMYKVMLLNDDYTPMEFVIAVLQQFFSLDTEQATRIMLKVHNEGPRRLRGLSSRHRCYQGGTGERIRPPAPTSACLHHGGKLMIAQELEVSLHMAFVEARQKRHEFITVEHLLLALIDNPSAAEALRSCGAKPDTLRKDLGNFINEHTPTVPVKTTSILSRHLAFQRVIQRAILHVQSSGKKEVNGANVLVAIYGEKDSHAVYFLQKQGVTRLDVVNFIARHQQGAAAKRPLKAKQKPKVEKEQAGPLEQYTINLNALALQGKIDPLIGRDKELERVIQTLCRRRKNNPLAGG